MRADAGIAFCPRHDGFFPIAAPFDSQARNADTARTSGEVGVGRSPAATVSPVAFSLRRKQSVTRSPRLYKRPDRRLYSGNMPATSTSGSDFSRWPAFIWQLVHDIPP